ncbi:MAG: hypothetical protein ABL977_04130 [Candidatus Eisenbacteria bacterium]
MNASARARLEPVARSAPATGSGLSAELAPALTRALEWAGDEALAVVLSGSHARGEAVWAEVSGQRVSLSDLDVYAILRDESACAAARERARRSPWRPDGAVVAPLEVAFVTLDGLAAMSARPGTVELARSGRVIAGDPGVLARLPGWPSAQVSAEERQLLLENRAFELLAAHDPEPGALGGLLARHALMKAALDAAAARLLALGEWPAGAAARVERARELPAPGGLPSWLEGAWAGGEPLWREALAWRMPGALATLGAAATAERRAAVRLWCVAWWEGTAFAAASDPWERAVRVAARGSWARRLRRAWAFRARTGATPALAQRLRHALAGTPALRVHGSAAVLLLAAAQSPHEPRLPAGALHALHRLGVTRATAFDAAVRDTFAAWDQQLHDGLRTRSRV